MGKLNSAQEKRDQPDQLTSGGILRALFGVLLTTLLIVALTQSSLAGEEAVQGVQVGLIIVMMALGLVEIRRTNRRIAHLGSVAMEIGRGEYGVHADCQSGDALGRLGADLNTMAAKIESTVGELEDSQKQLTHQSVMLERVNDELRQADRMRRAFVANISHELRTPLNSIIGFSGILLKNPSGNLGDDDLKRVEKINRNGKNLLALINDLLDLSKIEAGRMECYPVPTSLNGLVAEVGELLLPQAQQKGIDLRIEVPESEQTITTDDQKLRQVLINLLANAIQFTRQGSATIQLHPVAPTGFVCIQVEDTGVGIPKDQLASIFEPFRQSDHSTVRQSSGTGLGLTISRSLVDLLGGTLTLESEIGRGSTFTLRLSTGWVKHPEAVPVAHIARLPDAASGLQVGSEDDDSGCHASGNRHPITHV